MPEADAVLVGLHAQVDDLAEVDEHGAVGGLDLVPALAPFAQCRLQLLSWSSAMRRDRTCPPLEADRDALRLVRSAIYVHHLCGLDDLGEHAARGGRVQERDA